MSKEFKNSAIVIVVLCMIFAYRDHRAEKRYQSGISELMAKDEKAFEENTKLYNQCKDSIDAKNMVVNKIIHALKPLKIKDSATEVDAIVGYMSFLSAKEKDSITRAKADPKELLNKINYQNTVILFYDKLEADSVNLSAMLKRQLQMERKGNYNTIHGNCFDMHNDSVKNSIKRFAGLQYLAVVQKSTHKAPSLMPNNTFDAGFTIFKMSVYDMHTLKKLKDMNVFASNSDKIRTMGIGGKSQLEIYLRADLERECSKAIEGSVYGDNNIKTQTF